MVLKSSIHNIGELQLGARVHILLAFMFIMLFPGLARANPEIDAIALNIGQQVEKKARDECHSLAKDQVADDLPSATDKEREQKVYNNSYERCMMEAMAILKKDVITINIQPKSN